MGLFSLREFEAGDHILTIGPALLNCEDLIQRVIIESSVELSTNPRKRVRACNLGKVRHLHHFISAWDFPAFLDEPLAQTTYRFVDLVDNMSAALFVNSSKSPNVAFYVEAPRPGTDSLAAPILGLKATVKIECTDELLAAYM